MRRADREVTDREEIESILERATVCRLGMCADGEPYVVPLSFGYVDGRLYFHSASEGKKLDILRGNGKVCFEVDVDTEVIPAKSPCGWGMRYASVIGFGTASIVEDLDEKRSALDIIMTHYGGHGANYPALMLRKVAIIRVDIENMTGKRSGQEER
ncbi:MAG: pyridoxamine 5'-phosphate oxidase family protein [Methanopyri archaeon]|nr:pyridoxamine 5'-phosphate oxidase family protein [Methanopyri archaeon]